MGQGMTRREFLHRGLTIVAMTATAPSFLTRTALALTNPWDAPLVASAPGVPDDRVLVVVQMGGGNDGLNTVVPYADDAYYRARPRLAVPRQQVIRLTDEVGLHPRMARFKELYDRGSAAIIQGVGYPNPSRSHFRAMEIWQTADPEGRGLRVGWIGRYFDSNCPVCEQPTVGVNVGPSLPLALRSAGGQGGDAGDARDVPVDALAGRHGRPRGAGAVPHAERAGAQRAGYDQLPPAHRHERGAGQRAGA